MCKVLSKGTMPNLRKLDLNSNHIGEPYLTEAAKRERQALLESVPDHIRHLAAGAAPDTPEMRELKDLGIKARAAARPPAHPSHLAALFALPPPRLTP